MVNGIWEHSHKTTKTARVEMIVFKFQKTRNISIEEGATPGGEGLPKYFLILFKEEDLPQKE